MDLFRRTKSELRNLHRESSMALISAAFGTRDLRGRLEWACNQRYPDREFLTALLKRSQKLNDELVHARILRDHATPAELTPELIRMINVHETFGIAGTRMLTEVQNDSTRKLYGPIMDEDGAGVLVMVDHSPSRATMVKAMGKKREAEVRTDAEVVIDLLFADWERGGPKSAGVQTFMQEMGLSTITTMEKDLDEVFNVSLAVSDDFDVQALEADAVLVLDDKKMILFEDPSGFAVDKILISTSDLSENIIVSPMLDDEIYTVIADQVRQKKLSQCYARVFDGHSYSPESIMMAAKSEVPGKMVFITERRFCPQTLPQNGRLLETPKRRIGP